MMRKKAAAILTAMLMTASAVIMPVSAEDVSVTGYYVNGVSAPDIRLRVNDREPASFSGIPVTINDTTYLPLRSLCEEVLGMRVDWYPDDPSGPLIDIWQADRPVKTGGDYLYIPSWDISGVSANNFVIHVDGKNINTGAVPVVIEGRTYLPVRAICEALNMNVEWLPDSQYGKLIQIWSITRPEYRGNHEVPVPVGQAVWGEFAQQTEEGTSYVPYALTITDIYREYMDAYSMSTDEWAKTNYIAQYSLTHDDTEELAEDLDKYMENLYNGNYTMQENGVKESSLFEIIVAKVRVDVHAANTDFVYTTSYTDLSPSYCGETVVDGLIRKYAQYADHEDQEIAGAIAYQGRAILSNGVHEGYMMFVVYKNDEKPRVKFKDGQYLALYKDNTVPYMTHDGANPAAPVASPGTEATPQPSRSPVRMA